MSRGFRRLWWVLGLLFLAPAACSRAHDDGVLAADGLPVDTELMAYLSLARARHHEANLDEDGDVPAAVAALRALVAAPRPHPDAPPPEVEEILADTLARLADLDLQQHDVASATEDVREGLLHAPGASYFRGHLLEMSGLTEEARAAELRDAAALTSAAAARSKAVDLFHQAVLVQEQVIKASVTDEKKDRGGK